MLITERYFAGDRWRPNLEALVDIYRSRRDAMLEAIDETFPDGATWTDPAGGFYVWVTLPEWVDTRAMLAAAVERRVAYVPGHRLLPRRARREPDAAGVLLPHRGPDPRGRRPGSARCWRRGAAVPEPASMRVAVLAGGRTPERDVSLRAVTV